MIFAIPQGNADQTVFKENGGYFIPVPFYCPAIIIGDGSEQVDGWFAENLPWPPPCKNQEKVVCFFKTENSEEMMKMIRPALWLLERYHHPYFLVYTNTPGEIVYEDKYQVAVKVPGYLKIEKVQENWSPQD